MRPAVPFALMASRALAGCQGGGATGAPKAAVEPKTDEEKTIYTLGVILGRNIGRFKLTPAELALVQRGIEDSVTGKTPAVDADTFGPKLGELEQARMAS